VSHLEHSGILIVAVIGLVTLALKWVELQIWPEIGSGTGVVAARVATKRTESSLLIIGSLQPAVLQDV
jgi:hypothetical protein